MSKKMAGSGDEATTKPMSNLNNSLYEAFRRFASKGNVMYSKELYKWCKDAKILGKYMNQIHLDVSFFKVKKKWRNVIDFKEVLILLDELLMKYIDDSWVPTPDALSHLKYKLSCAQPTLHCTMPDITIGAVDRLTDKRNYTGCQKVRFDNLELRNRKSKYDGWVTYDLTEEPMPPTIQILPTIQTTTSDTTTTTVHADEIALETAV